MSQRVAGVTLLLAACLGAASVAWPLQGGYLERFERFDRDPGWDGHNNRPNPPRTATITQDFGYSRTSHAGGPAGEIGGRMTPAAEPAYYAKRLAPLTFNDKLSASGTLAFASEPAHVLIGFFNAGAINEWRTPNSIVLRIIGRGDHFFAYVEYATRRWRAGGDSPGGFPTVKDPESGRTNLKGFAAAGVVHKWTMRYDPDGNGGGGAITVTMDGETAVCNLDVGHKVDGATFTHFGLLGVAKSADSPGTVWLDDVAINGAKEDFRNDPGWDQFQNRRTYQSTNIRPQFDFGYTATRLAGGAATGELGGLVFRGDCRYPSKLGYYGDRVGPLSLAAPLRAGGKLSMHRGVSDSTALFGFFNARDSVAVTDSQKASFPDSFLGAAIEGPSSEGFLFYPVARRKGGDQRVPPGRSSLRLQPDGVSHTWSLDYDPRAADGRGRITLTLDGASFSMDLAEGDKDLATRFDRFGIVTTWIDGNAQRVYLDDLRYTARQE